jgi:hypothetical protein
MPTYRFKNNDEREHINVSPLFVSSYPRSGNTFLRTVLNQCFNLKSGSVYVNDFSGNIKLENYVGHVEHNEDSSITFPEGQQPIIKTHEKNQLNYPAIYVLRDGRAATVSLWEYYRREYSISYIIEGNHVFGKWSDHINSWNPLSRPNTLLLKYEDISTNLDSVLLKLSDFLNRDALNHTLPSRETIADIDGRWVRKKTNWESELSGENLDRFNELNKTHLKQFGYL